MIKAIDFFCGAGGLTRGLLDAGITVLAGIDIDPRLKQTYETNNRPSKFICGDIATIDIVALRRQFEIKSYEPVLYAACTPCQPFSTLNRIAGQDSRKFLLLSFAELLEHSPPDLLLIENVPGLNNSYGREVYKAFLNIIGSLGFDTLYPDLLDAKDFGVPQTRKRFILLASRHGDICEPNKVKRQPTVRDFTSQYPAIQDGDCRVEIANHEARKLMPHHKLILQAVPKNGGSRSDIIDKSLLLKCHREHPNVHKDVFGRMAWDSPAPTLTGRCTDVYNGRFAHPEQDRGISLREAAALQTFRDNYVFYGSYFNIAQQIGNAVPVKLAKRLGLAMKNSI
jgi:DNA (cytosine-5)-methyltransferase 1